MPLVLMELEDEDLHRELPSYYATPRKKVFKAEEAARSYYQANLTALAPAAEFEEAFFKRDDLKVLPKNYPSEVVAEINQLLGLSSTDQWPEAICGLTGPKETRLRVLQLLDLPYARIIKTVELNDEELAELTQVVQGSQTEFDEEGWPRVLYCFEEIDRYSGNGERWQEESWIRYIEEEGLCYGPP